MTNRREATTLIVIFLSFSLQLFADEGFNSSPPDGPLTKCWNSAVAVETASGALVKKVKNPDGSIDIFVLTAHHVIEEEMVRNGPNSMKHLGVGLDLAYSKALTYDGGPEVVRVGVDKSNDLAMLQVHMKSQPGNAIFQQIERNLDAIDPVPLANCSQVRSGGKKFFMFGFQATRLRTPKYQKKPIEDYQTTKRRWSTGNFLRREAKGVDVFNIDALEGNSGGPICDSNGALVTVVSGQKLLYKMIGNQKTEIFPYKADVTGAPCEKIKAFIEDQTSPISPDTNDKAPAFPASR